MVRDAGSAYHRHVSRRELRGARAIDHGTTCNAADTVDTRYRGSTLRMASRQLLQQIKRGVEPGPMPVSARPEFDAADAEGAAQEAE